MKRDKELALGKPQRISPVAELRSRVEDLERKPQPAAPTFQELFLDRSDEATRLLGNFVFDHAPVPPPARTSALAVWLHVVTLSLLAVGGALFIAGQASDRARTDELARRLGRQGEMLVTLEDQLAKAQKPEQFTPGVDLTGNAPAAIATAHASAPDIYLDLDQRCWVQITTGDGKVMYADFLPAGRRLLEGLRPVTVRDGCPGHVAFSANGRPLSPPRETGHAENKVEVAVLP